MTKFLSDQNRTCFFYESGTYALLSGARQWIGLVQEHSIEPTINVIPIRYQGSTDRNVDDFADGQKEWNGTLTYFPQDWKMLGYAIGSIADLTGSHIFTETNADDTARAASPGGYPTALHTITIEDSKNLGVAGSNFVRTIIGAMIDSYQLTFAQGEITSAEMGYIAQDSNLTSGAVVALAATTSAPYMFNEVRFHLPSGTTFDNVKELTFSANNNLERGEYLTGSRTLKEILPLNRDYEVTATLDMDTAGAGSFYDRLFIQGNTFNSMIKVDGTTGSLAIVMSGCKMTEMTVPSLMEGTQEQSFTFVPDTCNIVAYDSIVKYVAE